MIRLFITIPQGEIYDTFVTAKALKALEAVAEVDINPYDRDLTKSELCRMAGDADVLLTGWGTAEIDEEMLGNMPKLRLIAHTGGTVATLILDNAAYHKGVHVLSGNEFYAKSVAEGCMCYALCSLRKIEKYVNEMRTFGWRGEVWKNRGLFGKKVGLVSFGAIAKYFCQLLHWFDTEILVYSNHMTEDEATSHGVRLAGLEEIFSCCDVVSIHSALTPKTVGLVSRQLMELLKPDALLMNTARGAVIDEAALCELLSEGRFYAALDVYAQEPPPQDSPLIKRDNVLPLPHMGGPTIDVRELVTLGLAEDIRAFCRGDAMKNEILPERAAYMSQKVSK
jgi:phosphoglycerate dehydrogenase-like enzyme